MYLPAALEADGGTGGQKGYVGTLLPLNNTKTAKGKTVTGFSELVKNFANKPVLFGGSTALQGQSWPQYYLSPTSIPVNLNAPIKLPGGQNIFKESPGNGSYGTNLGILTSGQAIAGFPGTNDDYAANALTRLWFSWLNYYEKDVLPTIKNPAPSQQPTTQLTTLQTLYNAGGLGDFTFNVPAGDTNYAHQFATTVFTVMNAFSLDQNIDTRTRFVSSTGSSSGDMLTGLNPAIVAQLYAQPNHGTGTVVYSSGTDIPSVATGATNDVVINVPSPTSTSIQIQTPATTNQSGNTYSFYFVGATPPLPAISPLNQFMGFIYGDNDTDPGIPPSLETKITNDVIALMRGVPSRDWPQNDAAHPWYPKPGDPTQATNSKYELNPYVWFLHKSAAGSIYAYAFSVDDEWGNRQVYGTDKLLVTIGGPIGLIDHNPDTPK